MRKIALLAICLILSAAQVFGQQVVINEVLTSNEDGITDFDGDRPDWIELYNRGSVAVNLGGYHLTDDPQQAQQWTLPDITLDAGQHLLIFASGKDRNQPVRHFETVVRQGDEWHYFIGDSAPPTDWNQSGFDESQWVSGPSGFGYGDGDDATDIDSTGTFDSNPTSVYIHKKFPVDSVGLVQGALLHVDYDDAFVAYINGVEVARSNVGEAGVEPEYDQLAYQPHEAKMYRDGDPERFDIKNVSNLMQPGQNTIAIQTHNVDTNSSDMTMIPYLSFLMTEPPENPKGPVELLGFRKVHLHTNFRLDTNGEQLVLFHSNGDTLDQISFGYIPSDYSYGRTSDGGSTWGYFPTPTPDSVNNTDYYAAFNENPSVDTKGGIYDGEVTVSLDYHPPQGEVRYTTDGSLPDDASSLWKGDLRIDTTTVLRLRTIGDGNLPSQTVTHTYFINESFSLPVVSLASDPPNLFSSDRGIYVKGDQAEDGFPYFGANFHKEWERPVHIELYEPKGEGSFRSRAGMQMHGSWSLGYPQKSLALFARGEYGASAFEYRLFPSLNINRYQAFVLRNSGQDWGWTMFRDAMIHSMADDRYSDVMAYRPVIVFINGRYWGVHNMREKQNEHYLASHHAVAPDKIDMIENDEVVIQGSMQPYRSLQNYVSQNDLENAQTYQYVSERIDVDNFIDYMTTRMFAATSDWPWNNVKVWKPQSPDGQWRWVLFDGDYGLAGGHLKADTDMYAEVGNQDNFTSNLFSALLRNDTFRNRFINRYADRLNTDFAVDSMLGRLDRFEQGIEDAMPRHVERWKGTFRDNRSWLSSALEDMQDWRNNVEVVETFVRQRTGAVWDHLMTEFGLSEADQVSFRLEIGTGEGTIQMNSLNISHYPWQGTYFTGVPVELTANADPGYRFERWEGTDKSAVSIRVNPGEVSSVKAHFVRDTVRPPRVIINEINYHSSDQFNPQDWIELHNTTDSDISLKDWTLKDSNDEHGYTFASADTLKGGEYWVVSQDTAAFFNLFGDILNVAGPMEFGFDAGGEVVRIFDEGDQLVDSVTYDDSAPWPETADGAGATLALRAPDLDNDNPENWAASEGHGSPAAANQIRTAIESPKSPRVLPEEVELRQNYPNPFNPVTQIVFNLPRSADIQLLVYDVTGHKVKTLVKGRLSAGRHQVAFDAGELSSGVYLYRLQTPTVTRVRKMLLLR